MMFLHRLASSILPDGTRQLHKPSCKVGLHKCISSQQIACAISCKHTASHCLVDKHPQQVSASPHDLVQHLAPCCCDCRSIDRPVQLHCAAAEVLVGHHQHRQVIRACAGVKVVEAHMGPDQLCCGGLGHVSSQHPAAAVDSGSCSSCCISCCCCCRACCCVEAGGIPA